MSVPQHIFSKAWADGNFIIPIDRIIRSELKNELWIYSRTGAMFFPENLIVAKMVRARLAAIEAFDATLWQK